jgi:hypothetical protein
MGISHQKLVLTVRDTRKQAPCERCGRYFAALIKYVLLPIVTFLPSRPFKSALNAFVAEERALQDLGS